MRTAVVANFKRLVVWLVVLALLGATLFVVWADSPEQARAQHLDRVDDSAVDVDERQGTYVIRDSDGPPARVGLVFYPGAHVDPENYVPVLAPLVEQTGVRVYIPKMPFHLAILDTDRAGYYQHRATAIEEWYVGGHSLGGAMACRYASNNADRVEGVVLFASFCDNDISDTDMATVQVLGTRDGLLSMDRVNATAGNLPQNRTVDIIEGANHSQFGSYAGQPSDNPAYVSYDLVHQRAAGLTAVTIAENSQYVSLSGTNGTFLIDATENQTG